MLQGFAAVEAMTSTALASVMEMMQNKLAESGLDMKDGTRGLGMLPLANGTARELVGYNVKGFSIPYHDINGKPTGFWRARLFGNTKNKYLQAKGSGVSVYFPPIGDANWKQRIKDTTKPIIITEGELKAACATKLGFATIGLGGVASFQSKKKSQRLIPDLEQIDWRNRPVYICYDSDAKDNPNVTNAECALAEQIFRKGARIYIVRLPSIKKKGVKTGLDDYLMDERHGGTKRFVQLIKSAEEWGKSAELLKFNNEVIFIFDPGVVVVRKTNQRIDPNKMIHAHYADRKFLKTSPTLKDPLRRVEASVPAEWMKWEGRATATKQTYAPGEPRITKDNDYNRWIGWGTAPVKGDITPWRTLMDFIFKDAKPEDRKWFEQWLAYPIQHPGTKLLTSVLLWSVHHGTGKTLVGETMRRIYGYDNSVEIGDIQLDEKFNDWAANKQFVMGNEITGSDKRSYASRIKSLITQTRVHINEKYVPGYELPDCANYLWTANHNDAFFIENTDRRFFILEIRGAPMAADWYTGVYDPWYKSEKGIAALFYYFKHLDLTGFHPSTAAPMTESKIQAMEEGMSDMAQWVHDLPNHPKAHILMTIEEVALLASSDGKLTWTKSGIARAMRSALMSRPLGDITALRLDDKRRIRPFLVKKNKLQGMSLDQHNMRELWYSDRPAPGPRAHIKD